MLVEDHIGHYNDRYGLHVDRKEIPLDRVASYLSAMVRQRRTQRQWSIDELVVASGVSKGSIVAIENGATNPNLGTIVRLADALGMSVTELLEPERVETVTVVPHASQELSWQNDDGSAATLILTVPGRTPVEFWRWTLTPGSRYEGNIHPAATVETVTVLTGTLTLEVDGTIVIVSPESTATFTADRPHAYVAGDEACVYLMTVHIPHSH